MAARKKEVKEFAHGYGGYTNRRCRCDNCREANRVQRAAARAFWREERTRTREAGFEHVVIGITHGVSGSTNYSCRCDICVNTNRVAKAS